MTRPSLRQNYNGLHLPGGAQSPEAQQAQIQLAFAQQVQAIAREIYVRVAAGMLDPVTEPAEYREIAARCQTAALAYFEGAGMVRPKQESDE